MTVAELSRKAARLFNQYKVPSDTGFDWAVEIDSAKSEKDLSPELQQFLAEPYLMTPVPNSLRKHGNHNQLDHGRPKGGGSLGMNTSQVTEKTATPAQADALYSYFADGYEFINGYARGKKTVEEAEYNGVTNVQEKIAIIDNVIDTCPLTDTEMTVYRGISANVAAGLANASVGTVVENKGFLSTSKNKKVADSFAAGAIVHIRVPKGVKAFDVQKYVNKKEFENEIVFARDTQLVITDISDDVIFADLIP